RDMTGLTSEVARRCLAEVGKNELPSRDRRTRWQLVIGVVREPMLLLLLCASVIAIIAITLLQERRSERALDALRELASPHARVLRDGAWRDLDAREL